MSKALKVSNRKLMSGGKKRTTIRMMSPSIIYFLVDFASRLWLKWHNNDLDPFSYCHIEGFLAVRTSCCEHGFGIEFAITKNYFCVIETIAYVILLFIHSQVRILSGDTKVMRTFGFLVCEGYCFSYKLILC